MISNWRVSLSLWISYLSQTIPGNSPGFPASLLKIGRPDETTVRLLAVGSARYTVPTYHGKSLSTERLVITGRSVLFIQPEHSLRQDHPNQHDRDEDQRLRTEGC